MARKRKQGKANYDHPAGKRYHGLKNQGATCYLNSVLQVLYMTKDFREAVSHSPKLEPGFIDLRLHSIFNALTNKTATTQEITNHLGIKKVNEQQDAAECFDKILSCCSSKASGIFKGELTHKNKCSQCERETRTISPFWSLPLTLSDKKYYCVTDGIQKYFQESKICGENQLYCCQCHGKTDSSIKLDMHHHPDVLTLLLKRFKFDYQAMDYVKIKCHVKIPENLKIPAVEDESQTYRLYALVEHSGELRSGHYTARIRSQDDDKWYTFNDSTVTSGDYQLYQLEEGETSQGAYLLFYRKTTGLNPDSSEASTSGCTKTNEPRRKDGKSRGRREGERPATDSFGVREESHTEGEMKTEVVARDDPSKITADSDSLKSTSSESLEVRKPSGRNIDNKIKCNNSKRFDGQSRDTEQDGSGSDLNQDLNPAQSKKRKGKQSTKGHGLDSKQDVSENCPSALCDEPKETERKDQRGHEQTQRIRNLEGRCSKTEDQNLSFPYRDELQGEQHEHCGCNKYSEVQDSAGEDDPKLNQYESKHDSLDHCVERYEDVEVVKELDERSSNKHQQSKTNDEEENKIQKRDRLGQNSSPSSNEGKGVNLKNDNFCQIRGNSQGLVGEREGNQNTVQDEDGQNNLKSDTQQNINPVTQEMAANTDPNTQNGPKATGEETLSEQQRHIDENVSTGRENIEDVNKSGPNRDELQEEQHEHHGCNKYSEVQDSAGEDDPKLNQHVLKHDSSVHWAQRYEDEEIIKELAERSHNKHQQSKANDEEENKVESSDRLGLNSSLSSYEGKGVNPKNDNCCQIRENSEGLDGEKEGNQKTVQDEDGQNNLQSDTQQNINPVTQEMPLNMDPNTQNGPKATGGETLTDCILMLSQKNLSEQQRHSDGNVPTGRENIEHVNENKSLSESNLVKTMDFSPDAEMQREGGSGKPKKSKKGHNKKESVMFSRGLTCLRGRNTNPEGSQRQSSFQNNRNTI